VPAFRLLRRQAPALRQARQPVCRLLCRVVLAPARRLLPVHRYQPRRRVLFQSLRRPAPAPALVRVPARLSVRVFRRLRARVHRHPVRSQPVLRRHLRAVSVPVSVPRHRVRSPRARRVPRVRAAVFPLPLRRRSQVRYRQVPRRAQAVLFQLPRQAVRHLQAHRAPACRRHHRVQPVRLIQPVRPLPRRPRLPAVPARVVVHRSVRARLSVPRPRPPCRRLLAHQRVPACRVRHLRVNRLRRAAAPARHLRRAGHGRPVQARAFHHQLLRLQAAVGAPVRPPARL
jgi:hypothetical protein